MNKITGAYCLDPENKRWISEKAKETERSASSFLNHVLTKLRQEESQDAPR